MKNALNTCFSCLQPSLLTREHLIPQALGGRLKRNLYCASCNNEFGNSIDAELVKTFGRWATMLQLSRDRGSNRSFVVKEVGTGLALLFDGEKLSRKDPIVRVTKDKGKSVEVDVTARSAKELEEIMKSLRSKYKLSSDGKTFQTGRQGPVDTTYEIVIDTVLIRRAVTKMAYGLLCDKIPGSDVLSPAFDEVRAYVRGRKQQDMASANFIHTNWTCDYVRPLHRIHISMNRGDGLVYGFITIFGSFRFTVLLSNSYRGYLDWSPIDYTFDPVTRRLIEGRPNFIAPTLTEAQILRPKQSKQWVRHELIKANKMLEGYLEGYTFLDVEFEQSSKVGQ